MREDVLIRLRRQYSKDEYVAHLLKRISEIEVEKGIITSERDEALHELQSLAKSLSNKDVVEILKFADEKNLTTFFKKTQSYKALKKVNKNYQETINSLRRQRDNIFLKYRNLAKERQT